MSEARLKRRLKEAKRIWQKESRNPDIQGMAGYLPGVQRGFQEALRIIQDLQREKLKKARAERKALTRWSAVDLYHACEHAYGRLVYSDRSGAMKALKRALDKNKS